MNGNGHVLRISILILFNMTRENWGCSLNSGGMVFNTILMYK
jgi:hypothetical protein